MALTALQRTAIKKILSEYRKDIRAIVSKHKHDVVTAVLEIDKRKTEDIKRLIESA